MSSTPYRENGNPLSNWVYGLCLTFMGVLFCGSGIYLAITKKYPDWQSVAAVLALISAITIIHCTARLLAPQQLQSWIGNRTYRERFVFYCLHHAVIIIFLAAGLPLVYEIIRGAGSHQPDNLLWPLWICCLLVALILADLFGDTRNVWHPIKPTQPRDSNPLSETAVI